MFLKNALEVLKESSAFKKWQLSHTDSYHSYCFLTFEGDQASDWQIGYYNKDDTISTFQFAGKDVLEAQSDQIFKHPDAKVFALDMDSVKLDVEDITGQVEEIRASRYKGVPVMKTIMILQKLEDYGTVWNVTLITHQLESINIKIDAASGKVKHEAKVSLLAQENVKDLKEKMKDG